MWTSYGTGFITTIGDKNEGKTFFTTQTKKGAFVIFRIVSRRYVGGDNKFESMDCKRFITGDTESFCKMLKEKTMVSVSGTLEQYYNKDTKTVKYCINCQNVDFCGRTKTAEEADKAAAVAAATKSEQPKSEEEPF